MGGKKKEDNVRLIEINLRWEDSAIGVQQEGTVLPDFMGRFEAKFIDVFFCSFHKYFWVPGTSRKGKGKL